MRSASRRRLATGRRCIRSSWSPSVFTNLAGLPSSTGVVESFTLLEQHGAGPRVVSAETGVYFAVCPVRATCPAPAPRYARRAIDFLPRRQALELAVRTFLETSASIVAVSLPTRRPRLFIAERAELGHRIDLPALGEALAGDPAVAASSMRRLVDRLTRPRIFVPVALDATPGGGDTFVAAPLWPGR